MGGMRGGDGERVDEGDEGRMGVERLRSVGRVS